MTIISYCPKKLQTCSYYSLVSIYSFLRLSWRFIFLYLLNCYIYDLIDTNSPGQNDTVTNTFSFHSYPSFGFNIILSIFVFLFDSTNVLLSYLKNKTIRKIHYFIQLSTSILIILISLLIYIYNYKYTFHYSLINLIFESILFLYNIIILSINFSKHNVLHYQNMIIPR